MMDFNKLHPESYFNLKNERDQSFKFMQEKNTVRLCNFPSQVYSGLGLLLAFLKHGRHKLAICSRILVSGLIVNSWFHWAIIAKF